MFLNFIKNAQEINRVHILFNIKIQKSTLGSRGVVIIIAISFQFNSFTNSVQVTRIYIIGHESVWLSIEIGGTCFNPGMLRTAALFSSSLSGNSHSKGASIVCDRTGGRLRSGNT